MQQTLRFDAVWSSLGGGFAFFEVVEMEGAGGLKRSKLHFMVHCEIFSFHWFLLTSADLQFRVANIESYIILDSLFLATSIAKIVIANANCFLNVSSMNRKQKFEQYFSGNCIEAVHAQMFGDSSAAAS